MSTPDHPHQVCLSCGAVLQGRFCHACGQRDRDLDRSLWVVVADALSEAFEADGRLPRTVFPFFFQPGVVVQSWLRGRRHRWASPVRTYVFALFVGFLVFGIRAEQVATGASDAPPTAEAFEDGQRRIELGEGSQMSFDVRAASAEDVREQVPALFVPGVLWLSEQSQRWKTLSDRQITQLMMTGWLTWLPRLITLLIPVMAVGLQLLYWRRRFLDHLVFALDQHSRGLLLLALPVLIQSVWANRLVALGLAIHLFFGLRVVYGSGWIGAAVRFVLLVAGYLAVLMVGMLAITLLAVAGL